MPPSNGSDGKIWTTWYPTEMPPGLTKRAFALAGLLALAGHLQADVCIAEVTRGTTAGRDVRATRLTMIKDLKMRVEAQASGKDVVALYDAAVGEEIDLDSRKREARIRKFAAIREAAEKAVPEEWVNFSIQATGQRETIADAACESYAFTIRVPVVKDGKPTLTMTGKACVAKDTNGAAEYRNFVAAVKRTGFVMNYTGSNIVLLSLARAETTLYEMLADVGGIPLRIERDIEFEGGMLAGLLNKSAGSRSNLVTRISTGPLPEEEFSIPLAWESVDK